MYVDHVSISIFVFSPLSNEQRLDRYYGYFLVPQGRDVLQEMFQAINLAGKRT